MSEITEEQRAVRELSRIAHLYLMRGEIEKAEEVLTLVEGIQRRIHREQTQNTQSETG